MNQEQAETAITLSALTVSGIFAYRKAVEPGLGNLRALEGRKPTKNLVEDYKSVFGAAPPIEWGQWIKAAGSMFIIISLIGAGSPEIGGSLAVLVLTSAVVGNGVAIFKDLKEEPKNVEGKQTGNMRILEAKSRREMTPQALQPKG